ncbi:MAG TPA: hypothetical protein PLQ64_07145 [Thiobacillaceae bacterium]|nr:hypothetical protein [Thiobacillaceae bacterium]HNA82227.1 hypothetical protein [Thiobacillaceae bacterium]HNI08375.1 hypothetical protein [Thiobacillaceae bacterium]
MKTTPIHLLLALLVAAPAALAAGWDVIGPGTPTPRPPNPQNNPWLNYPLFYGPGAEGSQHVHGGNAPDALANLDRFMKLDPAARAEYSRQAEAASRQRGEALFADPGLGKTGLNCHSCHLNGGTVGGTVRVGDHEVAIPALHGAAQRFPGFKPGNDRVITLTEMQNNCIVLFLQGPALDAGSQRAADLTHFVSRLPAKP